MVLIQLCCNCLHYTSYVHIYVYTIYSYLTQPCTDPKRAVNENMHMHMHILVHTCNEPVI